MNRPKKHKWILIDLSIILSFLLLCCALIYFLQPKMFFYPYHDAEAYSSLQETENVQEITIPHYGGQLHGWLHRDPQVGSAPLLILYGGNSQNSSAWFRMFENTDTFRFFSGYDVMFVDYPGYGLSSGKPTEKSLFAAALAVYDFSKTLEDINGKVVILGYSLGTGVANYVASQREVDGLILLAPYDRGLSLYNDVLNIFHGPLKLLARFKFDSVSYAEQISVPVLLLASREDEVIPYTHAEKLSLHYPNLRNLIILDGISHEGFFYSTQVLESIRDYLASAT